MGVGPLVRQDVAPDVPRGSTGPAALVSTRRARPSAVLRHVSRPPDGRSIRALGPQAAAGDLTNAMTRVVFRSAEMISGFAPRPATKIAISRSTAIAVRVCHPGREDPRAGRRTDRGRAKNAKTARASRRRRLSGWPAGRRSRPGCQAGAGPAFHDLAAFGCRRRPVMVIGWLCGNWKGSGLHGPICFEKARCSGEPARRERSARHPVDCLDRSRSRARWRPAAERVCQYRLGVDAEYARLRPALTDG